MPIDLQKLEYTKTVILALLVSRKKGCTLKQLDEDYYEQEGEYIPWKNFGYFSLLNFLQGIPKTVQIEKENNTIIVKGIPTNKSKHVSALVAGQKDSVKKSCSRKSFTPSHYYPKTAPPRMHISAELLAMIVNLVNDYPDGINKDYVLCLVQSHMPNTYVSMQDMEQQLQELSHKIRVLDGKIYSVENNSKNVSNSHDLWSSVHDKSTTQRVNSKINSATCYAAGSEDFNDTSDFDQDYDFAFNTIDSVSQPVCAKNDATVKRSISSFIQETVSKSKDKRIIKKLSANHNNSNNNNNKQPDIEISKKIDNENDTFFHENMEILINDRTRFRLEKLIQKYPDGIWCADLPEKYLEEYKISLNYAELGFNSVREFASQLPEIFHCVQPSDTGDFMLYSAKEEVRMPLKKEKQKTMNLRELYNAFTFKEDVEPLPTVASSNTCKELIPDDVMTLGDCVGYINVEDLASNEEPYVEVVVVEVFTPSFFWIQLRKKQNIFNKFMDDLHAFYTTNSLNYIIPPVVLEKGLNCACTYNGKWHRGLIKMVKPNLQVTVFFYDYGTLKTYPAEEIHYLHQSFSYLPAQAIPCGLFNTKPCNGSKWSRGVTHEFALRTSDIPLVATIASINSEDNSMMVTLTDTLDDEDVHINDWLVEKNLAVHGKMGDAVDMSNMLIYVEENLNFMPEKCYEMNYVVPSNQQEKESTEESKNMPLISPESTLGDRLLRGPPGFTLSKCPMIFEDMFKDDSESIARASNTSTFNPKKPNTNPFLEDSSSYEEHGQNLSPQEFVKLWKENLRLQVQITSMFNVLLRTVTGSSMKNEPCVTSVIEKFPFFEHQFHPSISPFSNDKTNDTFLFSDNDITATKNLTSTTTRDYYDQQDNVYSSFSRKFNDNNRGYGNGYNNANSSFSCNDFSQESFPLNSCNVYLNSLNSTHSKLLQNTTNQEDSTKDFDSFHANPINSTFANYNTNDRSLFADEKVPMEKNIPFLGSLEHENWNNVESGFKETNPFKLSLAGKLRIPEPNEDVNCIDSQTNINQNFNSYSHETCQRTEGNTNNGNSDMDKLNRDISKVCESTHNYNKHGALPPKNVFNNDNENVIGSDKSAGEYCDYVSTKDFASNMDQVEKRMWKLVIAPPATVCKAKKEQATWETNKYTANDIYPNKTHEDARETSLNLQGHDYDIFSCSLYPNINFCGQSKEHRQRNDITPNFESFVNPQIDKFMEDLEKGREATWCDSGRRARFSSMFQDNCNREIAGDFAKTSQQSTNNFTTTSWSPINSAIPPLTVTNMNVDKGCITRPPTSHTSESISPPVQPSNTYDSHELNIPVESTWIGSLQKPGNICTAHIEKVNSPRVESEMTMDKCPFAWTFQKLPKQMQHHLPTNNFHAEREKPASTLARNTSICEKDMFDTERANNVLDTKCEGTCMMRENQMKDTWKLCNSEESGTTKLSRQRIFSRAIELSGRIIRIFHYQEKGWLLTEEFVEVFTKFKTIDYAISLLHVLNVEISFLELDCSEKSTEILQLKNKAREATWTIESNPLKIHLIPLESVLKVLIALGILTIENFDSISLNEDPVYQNVMVLRNAYEELKRLVQIPIKE